jgi:GMP synthase (glutamine-hydrolysing)
LRLLAVQNDPDKSLGLIAQGLEPIGIALEVHWSSTELPAVNDYDGIVVLPGLADAVDDDPAVHRARRALGEAVSLGIPILGLCLGGQLLIQALGGTVYRCPEELGYGEVRTTRAAVTDPLLDDAPPRFTAFHAHAYAFEPPSGAVVLAENDVCVQACRVGDAWAIQCHPEVRPEWVAALADAMRGREASVMPRTAAFFRGKGVDPDKLKRDSVAAAPAARQLANGIARGFASRVSARAAPRRRPAARHRPLPRR